MPFARLWPVGLCVVCAAWLASCGGGRPSGGSSPAVGASAGSAVAASSAAASSGDVRPRLVVLGDSLTAGLGLDPDEAYPALLQRRVDAAGLGLRVVNAGISGDTSAGGLSRVDLALEGDVRVLVVALGANDGLRGLPTDAMQRNLARIIERAQAAGAAVLLAGMEAPPNFGQTYTAAFRRVYLDLAHDYRVALLPFLLEGVAGVDGLNQADGLHPTAEGDRVVADHVWAALQPLLNGAGEHP